MQAQSHCRSAFWDQQFQGEMQQQQW